MAFAVKAIVTLLFISLVGAVRGLQENLRFSCGQVFSTAYKKPNCGTETWPVGYHNIPILTGVYCFNNNTGICKAFAGRFEFYFNVWKQEFLGPVERGQYVDANGYHQRVPTSYTPDGRILFADRAINWSRNFTSGKPSEYNLLSATSFNWCKYATSNNWPYKSSILDHDKLHRIYFFNRQSCIYNPQTKELQHYNTRFLHRSKVRIDLDYNPTIFAMEDNLANETRLVKHKRQHWVEVSWKLLKSPKAGIKFFVEMDPEDKRPLILDGKGPLLRKHFYNKSTNLCVNDYLTTRSPKQPLNARLVPMYCGLDQWEIVDYLKWNNDIYNVDLHSIPRGLEEQNFYGVDVRNDEDWEKVAKDGFTFSATTTKPISNYKYKVFSLFSYYNDPDQTPKDDYDEHYPPTYLAIYELSANNFREVNTVRKRDNSTKKVNLNYVDDIAYLEKCDTILVIFGPLYTEFKVDEFNLETKTPLGSIYDLGLQEMTSAFYARGDKIYFYHRVNFISESKYTCASEGKTALVTAKKLNKYKHNQGSNQHQEERHFKVLGMFQGDLSSPDAPDASMFPWEMEDVLEAPEQEGLPGWIWFLVALGVLILIIMFILGFVAFKRMRRRHYLAKTLRSEMPSLSHLSGQRTNRSAMGGRPTVRGSSNTPTVRSGHPSRASYGPTATNRTSLASRASSAARTNRSSLSPGSRSASSRTKRSKASMGSRGSSRTRRGPLFSGSTSNSSPGGSSHSTSRTSSQKSNK